jgi:DNA (cytosine-5)-methyltransferase 1
VNFYNEIDASAAAWLRELIACGAIPEGHVEERSIVDVTPDRIAGRFTHLHWFAGIGGWARALELAGWPADRPVWTASLPCQPFSIAGKQRGTADERHLWPVFLDLVRECLPPTIIGEQIASPLGRIWLAGVRSDLEKLGYAVGGADCCAAGVGAPHIRQRLYWVATRGMADTNEGECRRITDREGRIIDRQATGRIEGDGQPQSGSANVRMADSQQQGLEGHPGNGNDSEQSGRDGEEPAGPVAAGSSLGFWDNARWIYCRDGKWRRVEPSFQPLASRLPRGMVPSGDPSVETANASQEARNVRLKGYGNSIVPQLAAEFIKAFLETESP